MTVLANIASASWDVLCQMSPYLLFGFLMAGILSVFTSPEWVERNLGGRGIAPVLKAALFGIPLPLCSCSVLPVSASIRRHGASRGATVAFLLSTPQTGVDSILATHALLGPVFAIFRVVAAFVTGVVGGAIVQVLAEETDGSGKAAPGECTESCCDSSTDESRFTRALRYGFLNLPRDIGKALLLGIIVAGLLSALVPTNSLAAYIGGGMLSIVIMMAVGIPVYVCATASVPIAVGFMHMGASPGAAFAFLVAGPATNAAALATVWKVLEKRAAIAYLVSVAASAVGFGWLLDKIMPAVATALPSLCAHQGHDAGSVGRLSAILLVALIVNAMVPRKSSESEKEEKEGVSPTEGSEAGGLELSVSGMTCGHCAATVAKALKNTTGVREVTVDLARRRVRISGDVTNVSALIEEVRALGFGAELLQDK